MTLISVIMVFGMVVGIFLGVLLLSLNNRNKSANRFLGIFMIVLSVIVSGFGLTKFGVYREAPHFIGIAPTMIFLLGPLFYFYIQASIQRTFTFTSKRYLHFIPFLGLIIYMSPFYFQSAEAKLIIFDSKSFSVQHRIIISLEILHAFVYLLLLKGFLKNYLQQVRNSISPVEQMYLKWVKSSVNVFGIIISSVALFLVLLYAGIKIHPLYSAFIPVVVSVTIISLGFIALKLPIVFPPDKDMYRTRKYERSTLNEEQANSYLEKLHNLMKKEKTYLQKDITLQKLAELLSISPHHLSQIINEKMNQSFFDFMNSYRIEEAKQILSGAKGDLLTILAVSEESGFNSKSSFNAAFKKFTGKTPSEYKQNF